MISKPSEIKSAARVLALWLVAGCSVYDSSLFPSAGQPSAGSGGIAESGAASSAGSGAGDVGGSGAGESTGGSTANTAGSGDSGSGNSSSGGSAGTSAIAGTDSGANGGSGGVVEGGAPGVAGDTGMAGDGEAGAPPQMPPHELAQGKSALASTTQTNNDALKGNDADPSTRWCAANGNFPQWWRVDLGAAHELSSFAVHLEYPARLHSFYIETSPDDATYTTVPGMTFTDVVGDVQTANFPAGASARYVRITVTNGAPDPDNQPHFTWASFFEFSVLGN